MSDDDLQWLDDAGESSDNAWEGGKTAATSTTKRVDPEFGLVHDNWSKRRGKELSKTSAFVDKGITDIDAADMYGMVFSPEPELNPDCEDDAKKRFLESLNDDGDYQALHAETQMDVMASELAALTLGEKYLQYVAKQPKPKEQPKNPTPAQQKAQQKAEMQQAINDMKAASQAAKAAAQEVQELRDFQEAMGIGKEDGGGGQANVELMKKQYAKVKNDAFLKRVLELAGAYRRVAQSKQRTKVVHGYDDLIGVKLDGDVSRLIPSELAQLAHPLLAIDAMRRLVERESLCGEYRAVENVGKGPILICIDESGSMANYGRIENAKAMALAMAWIAKHQNRWCGFMGWSSFRQIRTVTMPPRKFDTPKVLAWLTQFLNGGTHLPLESLPEVYESMGCPEGKTDIVIITDGETEALAQGTEAKFKEWKVEVKAHVIGISIGTEAKALKGISDSYYRISGLSAQNEAVGAALSI